jgi:hypothetical protein
MPSCNSLANPYNEHAAKSKLGNNEINQQMIKIKV